MDSSPKNKKKLSSFTHPHVVLNLYNFLYFAEQEDDGSHWLTYAYFFYYGIQWLPSIVWSPTFFKMY